MSSSFLDWSIYTVICFVLLGLWHGASDWWMTGGSNRSRGWDMRKTRGGSEVTNCLMDETIIITMKSKADGDEEENCIGPIPGVMWCHEHMVVYSILPYHPTKRMIWSKHQQWQSRRLSCQKCTAFLRWAWTCSSYFELQPPWFKLTVHVSSLSKWKSWGHCQLRKLKFGQLH